jgi:hypothetical protein
MTGGAVIPGDELPELDRANEAIVGQIFAKGSRTRERGRRRPAIIDMPHGGELELEFDNLDQDHHIAFMPSNGARNHARSQHRAG